MVEHYPHAIRPLVDLIPYAMNSRTHSDEQVTQIAASMKEFGFTNPILIDEEGGVIAGHGRILAAKKLGMTDAPCITLSGLTEAQKKAYVIADNQLPMNADWNLDNLKLELDSLKELDFDLDLLGFDDSFIQGLLEPAPSEGLTDEDAVPDVPETPVTVEGDVWLLGNHRLMCGDSTSVDAVEKLMDGRKVDMVFTDPPYGIDIVSGGWVGGGERNNIPFGGVPKDETATQRKKRLGTIGADNLAKANKYAPVAGDDSIDVALEAIQVIKTLGAKVEIIWGGNYYAQALENSSCWIVWDKENTGNFADAELAWTNQKTAVRIFKHMWNGMVKDSERGQKRVHPTQKPIALAEWCFDYYGQECETVLDLFGGSGFTLMAAVTKNKTAFIMELSPHYCDVIINRWQDFTGKQAVLETTGQTFAELVNERAAA